MEKIVDRLFLEQDISYRDFNCKLIPNVDKKLFIGVRVPVIKKIAKEMINDGSYVAFINELPHYYFEENMLHSYIISSGKNLDEVINNINDFLPWVDNWAVSDAINPKIFKNNDKRVYEEIEKWIKSEKTYAIRVGLVSLLNYYLDDHFSSNIFNLVNGIRNDDYYVKMAIAWFYSYALIKKYEETIGFFEGNFLDKWIHNKGIQKAIESYRISNERKEILRKLRR